MNAGRAIKVRRSTRPVPALVVTALTVVAAGPAAVAAAAPVAAASAVGTVAAPPGTITTVAGGVGGPGRATSVATVPGGLSFGNGNLYFADADTARKVSESTDRLTTPVGDGLRAFGGIGDGGPATLAEFETLFGTAVDHSGNLLLADFDSGRVRVVPARTGTFYGQAMTAGHIYTIAGGGPRGYGASGVPARQVKLSSPGDVRADRHGNLVIADSEIDISQSKMFASVIRVVATANGTFYGQHMVAGDVYTVAGFRKGLNGFGGDGGPARQAQFSGFIGSVRVDATGNIVLADTFNGRIRVVAARTGTFYGVPMTGGDVYTVAGGGTGGLGDGGPATSAKLATPNTAGLDAAGNLVIVDNGDNRLRVVAARTGTFYGQAMTVGHIYTIAGNGTRGFSGDSGPATGAEFSFGGGLATDATGNLLVSANSRIRVIAVTAGRFFGRSMTAGDVYSVAGNGKSTSGVGGPAPRAKISPPVGLIVDAAGNQVMTDGSVVQVVARTTGTFYGQAMTAGDLYTVAGDGTSGFSGDGGPARKAELSDPSGVAVDRHGNLVVSDTVNQRIRVVAVTTGTFYGRPMTAGDIYTVAGDGTSGFSGDGGPARKAELDLPGGVAVDPAGNLLIADSDNNRVRAVAARTGTFYGVAMTAGDIYTVAGGGTSGLGDGGPATSAELGFPTGLAVDAAGNLVVSDTADQRIRVVAVTTGTFYGRPMTAGDIYTVAGDGTFGFSGDGGPATSAELSSPNDVAADAAGNLLIADSGNSRVRVAAVRTGTFYGVAMTAGDIYTVAGGGTSGLGDGGPATSAELADPLAVTGSATGNLLIGDSAGDGLANRVRMVTG